MQNLRDVTGAAEDILVLCRTMCTHYLSHCTQPRMSWWPTENRSHRNNLCFVGVPLTFWGFPPWALFLCLAAGCLWSWCTVKCTVASFCSYTGAPMFPISIWGSRHRCGHYICSGYRIPLGRYALSPPMYAFVGYDSAESRHKRWPVLSSTYPAFYPAVNYGTVALCDLY